MRTCSRQSRRRPYYTHSSDISTPGYYASNSLSLSVRSNSLAAPTSASSSFLTFPKPWLKIASLDGYGSWHLDECSLGKYLRYEKYVTPMPSTEPQVTSYTSWLFSRQYSIMHTPWFELTDNPRIDWLRSWRLQATEQELTELFLDLSLVWTRVSAQQWTGPNILDLQKQKRSVPTESFSIRLEVYEGLFLCIHL